MIDYQEAFEAAQAIVKKSAACFFAKNVHDYHRLGFEVGDLEGYLYSEILVKKYLPTVEAHPEFYTTLAKFKASFYTACRNSLLVHHQTYIKCKKRGDILRSGVVELDATFGEDDQGTTLSTLRTKTYNENIRDMIDSCVDAQGRPDWEIARPLTILAYGVASGKCTSKSDLRRTLVHLGKSQFERVWAAICKHMKTFAEDTFDSPIFTAYQNGGFSALH